MKWLLIDIREMYDKDGEQRPGKGIALKPENYNKIKVLLWSGQFVFSYMLNNFRNTKTRLTKCGET